MEHSKISEESVSVAAAAAAAVFMAGLPLADPDSPGADSRGTADMFNYWLLLIGSLLYETRGASKQASWSFVMVVRAIGSRRGRKRTKNEPGELIK